ncbi:MAG: PqqD family protein [Epulopiscium sp.]|nr:PqqD family protein [Candidatus Epulonipiscium sp.]
MGSNSKTKNMLEMIPSRNEDIDWEIKNDLVVLTKYRTRKIDKIMNKLFRTTLVSHTELEELGSFIWQECDGVQNIYSISKKMEEHFGDRASPVLDRLLVYMRTLSDNNFIELK